MRLVTLGAERNFAMNIVAETAGKGAVFALNLLQFDDLLGVAGETLVGDVVGEFDDLRCMRVVVAAQAAGQIVVGLTGVALAAYGDNFLNRWGMTGMAILAADTGLVSAAVCSDIRRSGRVTFHAVACRQDRPVSCKGSRNQDSYQQG